MNERIGYCIQYTDNKTNRKLEMIVLKSVDEIPTTLLEVRIDGVLIGSVDANVISPNDFDLLQACCFPSKDYETRKIEIAG